MGRVASQITSLTIVYPTVYSDADQSKHQSSASLAFVWGIQRDRWIPRTKGQLRGNVSIWWRHHECVQAPAPIDVSPQNEIDEKYFLSFCVNSAFLMVVNRKHSKANHQTEIFANITKLGFMLISMWTAPNVLWKTASAMLKRQKWVIGSLYVFDSARRYIPIYIVPKKKWFWQATLELFYTLLMDRLSAPCPNTPDLKTGKMHTFIRIVKPIQTRLNFHILVLRQKYLMGIRSTAWLLIPWLIASSEALLILLRWINVNPSMEKY